MPPPTSNTTRDSPLYSVWPGAFAIWAVKYRPQTKNSSPWPAPTWGNSSRRPASESPPPFRPGSAGQEKGRFRNEAAFAPLAGASPIPASSGLTTRHRLNRYGDRDLNQALHHITITRERCHPPTRDYINRRTAEGKTRKEIRRCLKRYLARQIFKILENNPPTQLDTT